MEYISSSNRRPEGEGEEIGSVEYVPTEEPLQPGGGFLKSRVWIDGRVSWTVKDCFGSMLYYTYARKSSKTLIVMCRPQIVQHQILAIWR